MGYPFQLNLIFCRLWIPTTNILGISQDWRLQFRAGGFCMLGLENILINSNLRRAFSSLILGFSWMILKLEECYMGASFGYPQNNFKLNFLPVLCICCLWLYVCISLRAPFLVSSALFLYVTFLICCRPRKKIVPLCDLDVHVPLKRRD